MALSNAVIAALQIMYTGRGVSQSDLNWWATQGANIGYTDAVLLFANSADASQKYPFLQAPQSASKEQYVIQVFQNLYNIAAADIPAAELTYWVNWLGEAPNNPTNTPNYLLFPDALNSASAAAGLTSRITALTNKSDISIENANAQGAAGNVSFTQALYSEAAAIIAPVNETDASVATAQQQIIASTGGGGTPFTFLAANPVLTSTASINVSPANTFLTSNSNTVNALTFLNGAIVIDPSTSDSDVLNALIAGAVTPTTIENVETVRLTATGAGAAINVASITKLKSLEVVKGDLQIKSAESHPINLNAGYASILSLNSTDTTQVVTVNLKGTASGASIVDLNNTKSININVQADSVLKNSGTVIGDAGVSPFNITGSKNLAIDGDVLLAAGSKIDASAFTGKLDIAFGKFSTNIAVVGGQGDDSFAFTSQDDLINGSTVNGNQGIDTLSAKIGATTTALDKVTNIDSVTLVQAGANTTITAIDALVAAGQTLKVDASSFTTKFLVFDGSAEKNGSFNLISGAGNDNLIGGDLADTLTGGAGNDFLFGNAGNDTLLGEAGNDNLFGDAGDDILNGGPGLDNLTGGAGKDKFVLDQATAGNLATIGDFTLADDVFALSNAAFTGAPAVGATIVTSTAGAAANLATTVIVDNTAAIAAANLSNVRFAYDTTTSKLLFDADGNFGAGSIDIAQTNAIIPAGGNFSIIA